MANAQSQITAQGLIPVPADVLRAGQFTSDDIHQAVFGARTPRKRSLAQLKMGIRDYARKRDARG